MWKQSWGESCAEGELGESAHTTYYFAAATPGLCR